MGWTSQYFTTIIIEGNSPQTGIFIYNGVPGSGTLIGSWTTSAGTDQYGNSYPAGINVNQGTLTGVNIVSSILSAANILNSTIQGASIINSTYHGGEIIESQIIFDSNGGLLLNYAQTTTVVTLTPSNGSWTAPLGNYSTAKVECWGSGAGGGGGGVNTGQGAESGGGAEYAQEPTYPITPGSVYGVAIPQGATGGATFSGGMTGGTTIFDTAQLTGGGVFANGGQAGSNYVGGQGGRGSTNTIHNNGGNGANGGPTSGASAGASGGNSGNSTSAGNNGNQASGSTGASSPTAQTGSGTGGAGGNANGNGTVGGTPGAGGGGAGIGSGSPGAITKTYRCTNTYAYYGNPVTNSQRNVNGSMYQGAASGYLNTTGDQYSFALMPYAQMQSDLSGATINSVSVSLTNQHSWYGTGCYAILGYAPFSSFGSIGNPSGSTENAVNFFVNQGQSITKDITGYGFGTAFQSGAARSLMLGPSASTGGGAGNLWNYGYFAGGPNSVSLTINYTPSGGGASQFAGNGGPGRIQITYQTNISLVSAISPQSGQDSSLNAFAAGYTGVVQAFHPGSVPTAVETWQSLTLPSGLTGSFRYKMVAEYNVVKIDVNVTWSATTATTYTFASGLPTAYSVSVPNSNGRIYTMAGNATMSAAGALPRLFIGSAGSNVQILVPATSGGGTGTVTVEIPRD